MEKTEVTLESIKNLKNKQEKSNLGFELSDNFIKRVSLLATHVKDFMMDAHKLLFISGTQGSRELCCYFSNAVITVHWNEKLKEVLKSDVEFATDIRFLAKVLSYCKDTAIISDIYREPSIWLYGNKIQLINTNITRDGAKLSNVDTTKSTIALPEISEVNNIIKKYHLEKGSLAYSKEQNFYYKDFNLNITGIFSSNVELPLSHINLETLRLVNAFAEGRLYTDASFTTLRWSNGAIKTPHISVEQLSTPELLKEDSTFIIDIDILKQLLKIIKSVYNNIQITLRAEGATLHIFGYSESQEVVHYTIDVETIKDYKVTEVALVLDSFLDVIKEYSGVVNVTVSKDVLQFNDGTYWLIVRQN